MKRGKPLERKTRLQPGGKLTRRAFRRQPRQDRAEEEAFRAEVLSRAGGACERCGARGRLHAHHLLPRSRGGGHTLENGASLCPPCHGAVHDHRAPDWRVWVLSRKGSGRAS